MNLRMLVARCAQIRPTKSQIVWPLLLMALLYWLSSLPGKLFPDDPDLYRLLFWIPPSLQNALHVPAYALLAGAWRWVLAAWLRSPAAQTITASTIALAYCVLDEWHQSFVPGRYASLADIVLNIIGVALGIWLSSWVSRYMVRSAVTPTNEHRNNA